jgi:hypothetical protein
LKEAAKPLDAFVAEIPRRRPKDRALLAYVIEWRDRAPDTLAGGATRHPHPQFR